MSEKKFYVYIPAKERNSTFYVGVTSNLVTRISEHKQNIKCEFTTKYNVKTLVYFETHDNAEQAILREKRIKRWNRIWKMRLIEERNPDWNDLYQTLF